jgi:hypothetical protein
MMRVRTVTIAAAILVLSGCAAATVPSSSPPTSVPGSGRIADVRRLTVVPSGESAFITMTTGSTFNVGRVFNEVVKWYPKAIFFAPLTPVIQAGVDWFLEQGRSTKAHVADISPGSAVAEAFARALVASGRFDQVRMLEREPVGENRPQTDAFVRLTVPSWGLVRVRDGKPELVAAYADVHAQVIVPPTGVIVWEHQEDVTHADRVPLHALTGDAVLARQELLDVLERAGQRLANEFLYARGIDP